MSKRSSAMETVPTDAATLERKRCAMGEEPSSPLSSSAQRLKGGSFSNHETNTKKQKTVRTRRENDVANRLPTNICSVCLDNMNETPLRTVVALSPCGHIFHEDCYAGLRASVMERQADEDEEEDHVLPEERSTTCPSCKQDTHNFVRLFINLAGPSTTAKPQTHNRVGRQQITMEDFIRNDLWSTDKNTVQFAMRRIIHDSLPQQPKSFLLLGGHLVVLRAMERFCNSHQIQFEGSRILRELMSKGFCTVLTDHSIFEMLLKTMRLHPKQEALLSMICFILDCQCRYRAETNETYRDDVIYISLQVMKRFPKEPHSKKLLLTVVGRNDEGLVRLTECEGIGILIAAMKECAAQADVQSSFCHLLGRIAASSVANKREIILHDGVVVIAAALQRFHRLTCLAQGNSLVQTNAEKALQIMTAPPVATNSTGNGNTNNTGNNGNNANNQGHNGA